MRCAARYGVKNRESVHCPRIFSYFFRIEWSTYRSRRDGDASRKIRAISSEVMKLSAFKDHAFPNYPDDHIRDYFPNRPQVELVKGLFDPTGLSASSLSHAAPTDSTGICR